MSLKPKCEATWSDIKRHVAMTKNKKMSAINGSSIRLQQDPPRCLNLSSRGRKRGRPSTGRQIKRHPASKRQKRSPNEGRAISEPASTARSFMKVLRSKYTSYTSVCCRLLLPAGFCREHKVERYVTMTDSAGHKLWHMRFQYGSWFRHPRYYIISNGWREFSYEHSLKVNDRLVFTLLNCSHFVVEFATLNGSTRAMFPTRKDYPGSMNYSRLDCLASANRKVQLQAVKEKQIQKKAQVVKEEQIRKNSQVVKEKQIRKKAQVVKEKKIRRKTQVVKEKKVGKEIQVVKEIEIRQKVASIFLPDKQKLQRETFCQCNTVRHGKSIKAHSMKDYVFPEFTHLECKNPDGLIYLQILDSDSEISGVNED